MFTASAPLPSTPPFRATHALQYPVSAAAADRPRILVVFYSRDGLTRRVATRLAAVCGADIEEITELTPRIGRWGTVRSWIEGALCMAASVRAGRCHPGDYALVVVGTPVWCRQVASPVRRYLNVQASRFPDKVATFCTHGGSPGGSLESLARLCGREPVAALALAEAQADNAAGWREVQRFARELQQQVPELLAHDLWPPARGGRGVQAA